jgi:hypothetical protein
MKRTILQLLLIAALSSAAAVAQINCASGPASQKLVCEFPYAAGLLTNDTALGTSAGVTAQQASAVQQATIFNSAIATQVSQLPLASSSAGTVVLYKAGVPVTFDNLGPIMTDRAQTVGKHRLYLGFSASQFVFTDIDGISLGQLQLGYKSTAYYPGTTTLQSTTYTNETTNLNLRINQYIGVATFGLSNRIDVSAIVPWERITLSAFKHNSTSWLVDASNVLLKSGYSNPSTYTPGSAVGVGDVTVNTKAELWRGEHATVAGAMNVRIPSGDDLNLLGSGAWGFNPYIVYSYLWKMSPHVKMGYQWNTTTELNYQYDSNGIATKKALPGGMQYDAGVDWAVHRRLTLAFDALGNEYLNAPRLVNSTSTVSTTTSTITLNTSAASTASYSITNFSSGFKWNPAKNLVYTANVLFQLNNNGMRSRPTPMLGLSYKF